MVIKNLDDENFGETLQPPFLSRPSLKITALSYSWTTWNGEEQMMLLVKMDVDDGKNLEAEDETEGESDADEEKRSNGQDERAHSWPVRWGWNWFATHNFHIR